MALTLSYRDNNTAGTSVSAVSGNNNGGLLGGSLYLNEKMALGFLSSVEGIWDYTAGGIAKLFGADKWAERQFVNDWVNYNHADEWYDPGKGWQIAGDVAGGIGTSLPAIAGVGIAALSGGTLSPVAAGIISASVAGLGAAGNATKSAYQKTGQLGLKEFGYGALSGATEAGIEALTAGLGTGTGRIVSSLSKRAAGETVSTLGKSGAFSLLKTLGADFASEAVEEGLAEVLDPVYQRWSKVDPEAKNATGKEIGYAALVGGLSGLVMSGGALTVNTTANLFSGEGAVSNGTAGSIINTARQISEYESANDTGYESFKRIREGYEQLSASLIGTGGQVSTVKQKMLLGSLKRAEAAAFVEPFIERSAMALLTNADSAAERFSALGMTDARGKAISFTADQIRSGVDASLLAKRQSGTLSDTDRKILTRQLRAAIGTNSVLTSLAVMDATGRIYMDTEKFAQAALRGEMIADAADLNRFIETASPAQIEALSEALKIDNWAALTPDVFRAKVAEFHTSPEGQAYISQLEFVKQAQSIADTKSKNLPRIFRSNTVAQGMTHYASADGRVNMALLRDGDRYHLYDYESGNVSREMTISELNSTMRPYWNAQSAAQAAQDVQKPMDAQTQGQTQENATQSQTAAQAVRLNIIAAENISDWNKLSEPNRAAVRMTMRQAIAAGMDEDAALTFGRVAARSGMNIVFSAEQSGEGDARISGNTIYIDPEADKGRMENKLLLHEAGHALIREDKGAQLIAKAFRTVAPDRSQQIAQRYQKFYQQRGMSMDQYLPIVDEEIAAAGIEDTLGDINAWEYILAEEPSFGEKLLNFFRKSAQDYSSSAGLSREARKLLNAYKKMFAELSERNRGNNAITLANEVEYGRQDVDYEQIAKGRKSQRVHGERFALKEISDVVDKALANQGEIGEKYNQKQISEVPENVADLVSKASGGKIDISNKMIALNGDDIWHEYRSHGDEIKERGKKQIPLTPSDIKAAVGAIYDPDVVESVFSDINNPTQRQSFAYAKKSPDGHYVVVEAIGGKRNPNIIPVMILQFSEEKWNDMLIDGITLGELFHENDPKKKNALDIDFNKKNRVTVARSTSNEVIASFPRSPRFNDSIADTEPKVNSKSKKSSDERLALPEDKKYLDAVKSGDMETAQKMVDEAAKKAGYTIKAYHGTPIKGITTFDSEKIGSTTDEGLFGHGFYFTTNKLTADGYATVDGETMPVFLHVENSWWGLGHKVREVADQLGVDESSLTVRKVGIGSVVAPLTAYSRTFTAHLVENGYDSVIVQHGKRDYEIVVFDNTKIKSADPVTYDDNGNVIPLSERFNVENNDIRYALPEDGKKKKKYHMSHGQLRADVANKTRKKAYSKADARATLEGFTGADLLTKKAQNELADYLWQGFNTCETIDERQTFAKNFAQELGKRIYLVQDESPDAEMYRERVTYLGAGIGRLMISSGDYAGDFRHRLDKDGYKSFYARWSFGQNASKNGFTPYSVDKYVNDIAGEVPGMEYLREMHTADAMLEIDRLYTEAKAGAKAKVDLYTKDEIDALMGRFEEHIMKAFDERGRQSTFQKQVDKAIIDISQKADRSLRKMQKEVDEANQRYQDVLGDDKVVITKGQAQKQQAEFKSDRVYSRVDVSRAFEAIPVYNNIPSDVRRAFESEVWQGLNVRTTQNARELYLVDQVSNKLFQTILNEALTDEKMRELNDIEKQKRVAAKKLVGEERKARIKALNNQQNSILDDHAARFTNSLDQMEINRILDNAAKAIPTLLTAGKMSKKAAMEAEFDMSTAGYWKKEYEDAIERNKVLSRISVNAQKMKDLKMGTFSNATQMESDVFKGSIQKLASIEYRGNLSVKKAKSALREMAAWYTQEQKPLMYVDDQNPGYYNKGVAEMLRALTETDDPFTKDQLSVLQDVMSYFVKFVENYGKIWRGNKWIDAKTEAERYVAQIQENEKLGKTTFDRMMDMRYQVNFGDPHSVVKSKDMYADGFFTEMYEDIRQATLDANVKLMEVMNDYDKFMVEHKRYMRDAAKQDIRWVEEERTNTMPKMMAIGLYMTSKREHAQAGLALNGFKFKDRDGNIIKAGALIRNANPKEVTQAQISEAISELQSRIRKQLSAEDLEYIKILEKGYGQDLRNLKAERDIQRQGFTNVTTGYYYPIRRADIAKSIDVSAYSELDRVSNASFNKSIVEGARGKLFIEDADALFHRHANAVTRYWAIQPVIQGFNVIFNMDVSGNPNNAVSVATTSENVWNGSKEYFRDLIADVQGVPKNTGEYSKDLSKLRGYIAMSQLGANPKTWVTQFSSLFAASSMLDTTSIMSGVLHASKDVDAYCDLAKLRNYESAAIKAQGVLDKVSSVGEALMKPIAWTDRLVVNILWGACQVQVQRDSKLKIGTDENKVEAGKLLTEVLFETQQNSLATERSAMMRSGNELIRALTMFSADGMKVTGRFLDGIGEVSALKRRLEKASAEERPALEKKLKSARKKVRRATAAMVSSAVFAVAIAECFRWLYAKEREEDENAVLDMTLDFVGNLLGGLPGLRDVYTFFVDGYELDNYAISAVNDLLTSVKSSFSLAWDIVRGEGDTSEIPAKVKNLAYAAGQFTGLPVRNVYNVISGLTRRVAPQAGYKLDSVFYKKNYRTDLKKAVEEGDARRVSMLMGLISGKDITGQIGEEGMRELNRLAFAGASVLPRTVSNTVSVNGEEVELDQTQVEALNEAYSESWGSTISSLLSSSAYASMSDTQKEKAIRKAHEISYEQALVSIGIDRGERSVLIASVLGSETAAVYYALTSGISSDVDKNGETVEGSRRAKVISAIRSMNLGREKTLLLISLAGYSLQDGDIRGMKAKSEKVMLLQYIMKMPGYSSEQKAQLAKDCGFDVKNGRVMMSSL